MKRLLTLPFILFFTLSGFFSLPALAQQPGNEISVLVDGLPIVFDVKPVIQNGRTMVPFRALAEALNVRVAWNGTNQTVSAEKEKTSVRLQIGNKNAYCNGTAVLLDMPPVLLTGRTLIPLRFFSEAFDCQVEWIEATKSIRITSPPTVMTMVGFYALGDIQTSSWTNLFGKTYPDTGIGNTGTVSELALGWYSLDNDGNLLTKSRTGWQRPDSWEKVLEAAWEYNLKTQMVVHLTDEDGTISDLLTNEAAMTRAVNAIVQEAGLYHGVNLNFEGLGLKDSGEHLITVKNNFSNFVRQLSDQLKTENLDLTLTLHAPNSVYKGYDYQTLGKLAGHIIVMAYDYGPKPEPASLVIQAVEMAKAAVPPEKLLLGISTPSETPQSMVTKIGIAKRYNLNGIALWRLGLVSNEMWNSVRNSIQAEK
ncbi:MAG: copper amine oxidase [Peptococcaceae bacterium BRH_c4b]|nr:MAG: copper amine oxidase [Peptococcaceae bacterium BRH_c4b]